jgi:hypothetical protein
VPATVEPSRNGSPSAPPAPIRSSDGNMAGLARCPALHFVHVFKSQLTHLMGSTILVDRLRESSNSTDLGELEDQAGAIIDAAALPTPTLAAALATPTVAASGTPPTVAPFGTPPATPAMEAAAADSAALPGAPRAGAAPTGFAGSTTSTARRCRAPAWPCRARAGTSRSRRALPASSPGRACRGDAARSACASCAVGFLDRDEHLAQLLVASAAPASPSSRANSARSSCRRGRMRR